MITGKNKLQYFHALEFHPLDAPPAGAWRLGDGKAASYLVGPAFFDPQVNGYGGVDFQDADVSAEALEHAVLELRKAGCAHLLMTLITAAPDFTRDQLARLGGLLGQSALLREAILGFHLEGPFISAEQAYAGAHNARYTRDPDWEMFAGWQAAAGGRIRMVTLAAERAGAAEFIGKATRSGVLVSLGHSNATTEDLWVAVHAGARMFTHLGNGCATQMPRHDNIIQRVLAIPELSASLIADGIHIPPLALSGYLRVLGPARLVLITDAMAAAGAPAGRYRIGEMTVKVGEDRVVRNVNGQGLAGSALRPLDGFYNAIRFGGLGADAAWRGWTRLRRQIAPDVDVPTIMVPFH
jgi:N-acetylglucosamine-6-phosphate deacetylase